ncbi:MAG: phosphate-starvation-inducible PsiE family protein [Deltaproteobacteria bacterium]|nr:phosphate-starvation-inducible PsiE family protein [Deltaproteobacteria bacterium]
MIEFMNKFEKWIIIALIVLMASVVLGATIELAWIIIEKIISPPIPLFAINDLLEIFGFFLLVLIGLELIYTLKEYLKDHIIHVEIVLEVALIAIARKIIVLDLEKYDGLSIMGIAALVASVAVAYFAIKRTVKSAG